MVLLADGGSTKVDWRLIAGGKVSGYQTQGINPFIISEEVIVDILSQAAWKKEGHCIDEVHFYGAGLATDHAKGIIQKSFVKVLGPQVDVHVNDDLIGAARALFGNQQGIACILGTGSNSCYYNGNGVVEKIPALGYILGDEGSGAYLGKQFVNALLKRDFTVEFTNHVLKNENLSQDQILEGVYKKPFPNRYLASLTQIMNKYIDNLQVRALVADSFEAFLSKNVLKYPQIKDCKVGFVGSIAFYFEEILLEALAKYHIQNVKVIKAPIDDLVTYHVSNH
jgi:N-acetylglucosamine kinase-like BadF-type ATPase